ncbi:MAG: hypothetical protein M3350_09095, partial [Actinomycetota bacterium]|nr:hypothetical protein [Actinomycetota bacterium]
MRSRVDFGRVARAVDFALVTRAVTRRPRLTLAVVAVLALVGAALALRLEPSVDTDTLVDRGSETFAATEAFKRDFGDDSVVIMARGPLKKRVLTPNLERLIGLEGCLSGNVPPQVLGALPRVCSELAEAKPARVVFGPGTFLNLAATKAADGLQKRVADNARQADLLARQAAQASRRRGDPKATQERLAGDARHLAQSQFQQQLLGLGVRYGLLSVPSVDNPDFISKVVFDPSAPGERPKSRFAYLFPSPNAALIQVSAILVLLVAALLVMAATLAFVFRTRLRLLPLALALAAAAMTFGGLALVGGSLTMASIAVIPVLMALRWTTPFSSRRASTRPVREDAPAPGPPPSARRWGRPHHRHGGPG